MRVLTSKVMDVAVLIIIGMLIALLLVGCSASTDTIKTLQNHSDTCFIEYTKGKEAGVFTQKEQDAIETRYDEVNKLFKELNDGE